MGFLDKLVNRSANAITNATARAIGNAVGDVVEDAAQGFIKGLKNAADNDKSATSKAVKASVAAAKEIVDDREVDEKLRDILASEFPQYEVKEQVSPTTIGGEGEFLPYDFGVYENGQPKLFIMVVYNNTCASRTYRWSKEQAERAGVTMINFVYAFENKIDYMKERLHQYL
ncbi:MAG: hypothetical protein E7289_09080 [Lachnospiraceae bacterium]|nr:hypothetical protein [Lachnospiraceae bacterium]